MGELMRRISARKEREGEEEEGEEGEEATVK